MEEENKEWFASWFDTDEYHELYAHRDLEEARRFVERLLLRIAPETGSKVLDLACGAGRHAHVMAQFGLDATGIDLSANSIEKAKNDFPDVRFKVGDMREEFGNNEYQLITNLFTSFGYFNDADGNTVLSNVRKALVPNGRFVLDFLNATKVSNELNTEKETKQLDGGTFHIQRSIQEGWVVKDISVDADGQERVFQERVRLYSKDDLSSMLASASLEVESVFGNYSLEEYDETSSDRLILLARAI